MFKRIILILEISTAVAVAGLVAFQLYRIGEDKRTKEAWFYITVNTVLDEVVAALEKDEVVFRMVGVGSQYRGYALSQTKYNIQSQRKQQEVFEVTAMDAASLAANLPIKDPAVLQMLQYTLAQQPAPDSPNVRTHRRILVDNIVENIIALEVPIDERISRERMDTLFAKTFQNHGISLAFDYEVRGEDNCLLFGTGNALKGNIFSRRLFPSDLFASPYALNMCFPKQDWYIYKTLGVTVFAALGLLIVVMLVFFGTLREVFKQKKMSQIRADFVSNMTHELKTPITTILLASDMLKMLAPPASNGKTGVNLVQTIHAETKKLLRLVEQVLHTAQFEKKGKLGLKFVKLDIHDLISHVAEGFALQASAKNAQINLHLNASQTLIMADELHLSNVISNLIENALKYNASQPVIDISTQSAEGVLTLQVRDNGIGIPPQALPHIFEQFYRVPTGNLHNVKGFGLGLNYVKKIVDEHKGSIKADSRQGKGSIFTLCLPVTAAPTDAGSPRRL